MKFKIFQLVFLLLTMVACNQSELIDDEIQKCSADEASLPQRSVQDAINIACNVKGISNTKARTANYSVKAITKHYSRSSQNDTLIYVVQFEDDGFVLISKPTTVEPIIAVIEDGDFDGIETRQNESFQSLLANAAMYVATTSNINRPSTKPIDPIPTYYYDTIYHENKKVGPKIDVCWNQRWPENIYAPNKVAGCGPVAVAMALSYFEQPKSLALTFNNADKDIINLDWANLKKHKRSNLSTEPNNAQITFHNHTCTNLEIHKDLGRLVRQIGVLSHAKYNTSSTSTYFDTTYMALKKLLPNKNFVKSGYITNFDNLYNLIYSDGIALMRGDFESNNELNGHAWIVDGTWVIDMTVNYYDIGEDYNNPGYQLVSSNRTKNKYFHINWGWGGNSNGYFLLGIFDTSKADEYDFVNNTTTLNFNKNFRYIHIK